MNRRSAVRILTAAGAGSVLGLSMPGLWPARAATDGEPGDGTTPSSTTPTEPGDDNNFILRSEARLVLLDVSVESRDGGFVSGLVQDNFRVFENNRPQPITVFGHNDLPVTVGILVDESRSMSPKRPAVLTAALTFIAESNPADQMFVLSFNDSVKPGLLPPQRFSDNREELRAALFRGVSEGRTALYDAVVDGVKHLELGRRDKKALVLISDGGDNSSVHTRRETLDLIEQSLATIYTVGLFDAEDSDRDPRILSQLARLSGGKDYFPAGVSELIPICRRIAHDIRQRYTLGYLPPPEKNSSRPRSIRVEVAVAGQSHLTARTRTSYLYDPAESTADKPQAHKK